MKSIETYLSRWQEALGLSDWRIKLVLKDPDLFYEKGQVEWDGDSKEAVISLRAGEEDIEETIVHELLHLHFVDCEIALNVLEPYLGSVALEVAKRQMQVGIERAVTKLASALSKG